MQNIGSSPEDVYILIPRTCGYVKLHDKGELSLQLHLSLLIILPCDGEIVQIIWVNSIQSHKSLKIEGEEAKERVRDVVCEKN